MCKEVFTSKWSGTVCPETLMFSFQLLGSLGSRDSYRPIHASEPSYCRDLHCAYTCINSLSNKLPPCSVREGRNMGPVELLVFVWVLCDLLGQPCMYMCLWFVSVLCVQVPTANTGSRSLQVGFNGMEMQRPHPCQATVLSISLSVFGLKSRQKFIIPSLFKLVLLICFGCFPQATIHHWKCPL